MEADLVRRRLPMSITPFVACVMSSKKGIESLALPAIATGVGGLEWRDVRQVIEQVLGDMPIPIYVYSTYHKNVQASEPGV